jgi:hypothetical protein
MKRIVYTRFDGGISVCVPSVRAILFMQNGGRWADKPVGYVSAQIERQIAGGVHPDYAARFARALAFGGCSEAEAWRIVKDRDCASHGTLHEIHAAEDLPDRWFRDAWVRSRNGGPVGVDLARARPIQWNKARQAVADENKRREEAFDPLPLIAPPWETLRSAMRHARDHDELRKVWPL